MKKPFIATHSKLEMEAQCPWKFWLMEGSKCITGQPIIPFQDNQALKDGQEKHKRLEKYINGGGDSLIYWHPWWGQLIDAYKAKYPSKTDYMVEQKIGLSPDWEPHFLGDYYKPKYGNPEIIFQCAIDFVLFDTEGCASRCASEYAVVIDWKSGKQRPQSGIGQLGMYALFLFCTFPKLQKIDCYFVYLDKEKWLPVRGGIKPGRHQEIHFRESLLDLKNHFNHKYCDIKDQLNFIDRGLAWQPEDVFSCNETPLCGWCPATKEHCEYGD